MSDKSDFSKLSPEEQTAWADNDPDGYYAARHAWATAVAERQVEAAVRRQRAEDLARITAPFRWLWAKVTR